MNRANTNAYVINRANQEINANWPNWAQRRHIKLFSDMLMDKRARLSGRQASYVPASATPYPIDKRRIGGPRQQWLKYTNKHIWENVLQHTFIPYENTLQQNVEIFENAIYRHV